MSKWKFSCLSMHPRHYWANNKQKVLAPSCDFDNFQMQIRFASCHGLNNIFVRFKLIKIRGKRDKQVPVLLSKDMTAGITRILEVRNQFLENGSEFIFINPRSTQPVQGWNALKSVTQRLPELQMPEAITSTNVRKYIATVSQVRPIVPVK